MENQHFAERLLHAHLADKNSTIASIGVIYGLLIAANPRLVDEDWMRIHSAIRTRFGDLTDLSWLKKMDRIKAHGWKLHHEMAARAVCP